MIKKILMGVTLVTSLASFSHAVTVIDPTVGGNGNTESEQWAVQNANNAELAAAVIPENTVYGVDWDNDLNSASKNVIYDKIELVVADVLVNSGKDTNVDTNLTVSRDATTVTVNSSDGTEQAIPEADTTNAGVLGSDLWDSITAGLAKLVGIEDDATADQTGAEIKTAYELEADTNAFTDAEKSLLGNTSGSDGTLISGTAGGTGICAEWNVDGDLVAAVSAAACGSGGSGSSTWLELTDTPGSFTADYYVKVNAGGTALELVTAPSGSMPSCTSQYEILEWTGSAWQCTSTPSFDSIGTTGADGTHSVNYSNTGTDSTNCPTLTAGDVGAVCLASGNGNQYWWNVTAWEALTAASGVTSIIAGTGISVDQATGDVTVTATGTSSGCTYVSADPVYADGTDGDCKFGGTSGNTWRWYTGGWQVVAGVTTDYYDLTLTIAGLLSGDSITVDGTAYTASDVIPLPDDVHDITVAYGGTNDTINWTGDTVSGTSPDFTVDMDGADKAITGTFSGTVACDTYTAGNLLAETFDTVGDYDNTWTPSGTISPSEATTPGSSECGFDGEWLDIELAAGSWSRSYTYTDLGVAQASVYSRFILNVQSEGLADGETQALYDVRSTAATSEGLNIMRFSQAAGQFAISQYVGGSVQDTIDIVVGTTYCVETYLANGVGWEWRIDEVSQGSGATDPGADGQRLKFGNGNNADPNITVNYQIDHFDVSSTGWLGCEQ